MPDRKKLLSDFEKLKKRLDKKTLEKLRGNPDDSEEYRLLTNMDSDAPGIVTPTNSLGGGSSSGGSY